MTERKTDAIRPTDAEARTLARDLVDAARFGALGVIEPGTGSPLVSRVAIGTTEAGAPLTLVSDLAHHTGALKANPACSVLVGEPGGRGDPLTHPRLTLRCRARFVARESSEHGALRARWLAAHPKSKLYIDFGDFAFAVLEVERGYLNGGFGKAYVLEPADIAP